MEYVYAAMLLHKAGKPIDEDNVSKVLSAAGINVDSVRVKALVAALSEINIDEAIKTSPALMAMPAAPPVAPIAPKAEKPAEEKKEKVEEKKEEEALEGLGALFG